MAPFLPEKKMDDEPDILRFPDRSQCPWDSADDHDDAYNDFEAWEVHAELLEKEDYPALVDYCEREVARHPEDLHAQNRLGDAYVLNGQYEEAIRAMGKIHRKFPDIDAFQRVILDALFALGKTEDNYDWVARPRVLRLGKPVLDMCYEYLHPKRKPRDVAELETELLMRGYVTFSCEELLRGLSADPRFVVQPDRVAQSSQVRVRRKREGRTSPMHRTS
jgi:tetratricopeptide (TPR) repeat protein